nr:MAG TPA: hypothetical protein [Caudoviricetes sp.]
MSTTKYEKRNETNQFKYENICLIVVLAELYSAYHLVCLLINLNH